MSAHTTPWLRVCAHLFDMLSKGESVLNYFEFLSQSLVWIGCMPQPGERRSLISGLLRELFRAQHKKQGKKASHASPPPPRRSFSLQHGCFLTSKSHVCATAVSPIVGQGAPSSLALRPWPILDFRTPRPAVQHINPKSEEDGAEEWNGNSGYFPAWLPTASIEQLAVI